MLLPTSSLKSVLLVLNFSDSRCLLGLGKHLDFEEYIENATIDERKEILAGMSDKITFVTRSIRYSMEA